MERQSQVEAPEVASARSLPDRESIRRQEIARALEGLLRGRRYVLPTVLVLLLVAVLVWPTEPRVVGWLAFAVPAMALMMADRWRVRLGRHEWSHVPFDLSAALFMQGSMVALTGMIDSPLLPVLIAMSLVGGVALGPTRANAALVALVSLGLWALLALELDGRLAAHAALLAPPALDVERVVWRAAITQGLVLVAALAGRGLHAVFLRAVDSAIDARQSLLESLASRNDELVSLSGALAHELKNPLASVQGLVTLIERTDDNRARRFEVLKREIERMKATLDELLHFARPLDAGGGPTVLSPGDLFTRLATERQAIAEARGVRLSPMIPGGALSLTADEKKLLRALANLLDNAIDASPAGAEIEWIARADDERIELGVADRGPGVPEVAGRLGYTSKPEGSGLGLVVSRTIAEQHGGALIVRARAGGGAEVVLSLPLARRAA